MSIVARVERAWGGRKPGAGETAVLIVGTRLLQQCLTALLERQAGVAVVGACRGDEAVAMATERSPDVVLMTLPAHGRPAVSDLRALGRLRPAPRIVALGRQLSREQITAALELGLHACVSEEDGSEPLIEAVLQRRPAHVAVAPSLTPREREVLALIAQAKSEPQIARQLGLSAKTVHVHRTSMMRKLRVHNAIALVRQAIRLGLVDP